VGGSDNEKRKAVEQLREWRSEQVMLQRPFEVAKTEKDKRIIELIEELVDKTIRTYGGNPAPFQGERIFMVRPASIKKLTDSKFERGFYSPLAHYVMVERPSSDVQFALDLAHELLHVKSFQSGRVSKKGQADVRVYRSGT